MKKFTFFTMSMFLLTTMGFITSEADILDGVVGIWLFDEGSGDKAGDSSDAGNDGVFQGKPKWVKGKFNKMHNNTFNNVGIHIFCLSWSYFGRQSLDS